MLEPDFFRAAGGDQTPRACKFARPEAAIQNTSPSEVFGVEPQKFSIRIGRLQCAPAAADFAQQTAFRREIPAGLIQDAPDDIKPIGAAVESEFRLGAAFRRQTCHAFRIDVRRVGDDEIIAPVYNRRIQVAAMQRHTIFETEIRNIARGDGKRIFGDVDRVDVRVRKGATGENGKAGGTGAKLQHVFHRAARR